MKRWFVTLFAVALLATLVLAMPGRTAPSFVLKVATISPDNSALTNAMNAAAKEIEQRTAGRVGLRVYPGGVMGNDSVVLRKMRTGQIHGSTFTAGGVSTVYRDYQVLSLPLLFQDYREVDAVRAKIEPRLNQGLEAAGYVSTGIMEAGFVYMMSNSPITTLENLKGHKVWIPEGDPIGQRAFKALGVPPVPLPLSDVLTGLQTGLLDTVSSSPVGTVVLQWFTKVKYLTETPLLYSYGTLAFTKQAWNQIPAADQPVVREILVRNLKRVDVQNRIDNERALETLKRQGIQFVKIQADNLPRMQAIANQTIDSLVKEGQFTAALVAEVRSITQTVRQGK